MPDSTTQVHTSLKTSWLKLKKATFPNSLILSPEFKYLDFKSAAQHKRVLTAFVNEKF